MMCARASLHSDFAAWFHGPEEHAQPGCTLQGALPYQLTLLVNTMDLKNILCQIYTYATKLYEWTIARKLPLDLEN
jgi:hypothetical protein